MLDEYLYLVLTKSMRHAICEASTFLPYEFQMWSMDFRELEQILAEAGGSDEKVQTGLQERVSSDKGHMRIVNALLFGILSDRYAWPLWIPAKWLRLLASRCASCL